MPIDITIKPATPSMPEQEREKKTPMEKAYEDGVHFGLAGKEESNNPFPDEEKDLQNEWKRGFEASKFFVNRCGA